jgi:TldD protein
MIHEVLGHLLEADSFYEQPKLLEYFKLNKRIAATSLTVEDRPDIERLRGSYKFDDEGTPAKGTCLVQSGILKSFLNSKETAKKFNQRETGNARLLNYKFKPIVRMSNIVVHKGDSTFEQMIEDISYGVYLKGLKSANTNLTSFTIIPRECLLIEHGKVTGRVYNVAFVGTIDVLKNIRSIGDTLHINQGYSCNKYSQRGLPVGILAPYMHIDNCYIEEIR